MEMTEVMTLLGAAGGMQGVIELVKWWRGRRTRERQDVAAVVAAENENDRKQVDWLEKRLAERDGKIDHLYEELRTEQNARLEAERAAMEAERESMMDDAPSPAPDDVPSTKLDVPSCGEDSKS